MKIFKFFIVFFILICWSNCNSNKSNPTINSNYGNIQGKIRNALTDSMIVGAIINTNPPTSQVTSDSKGEYSIENIEAKSYIVSANKSGYISNSTNIEVFAGKVAKADISLTPAVSNSPPSIPHVVAPLDNSTVQTNSVTLSWSCTDPDNDPLKYDVYLSKTNPPTNIISSNQSAKSMTCCSLDSSTVYYWKVVAKDNKGGITSGNVWNFKTGRYSIPTFGLVAYYPFNSNANDESGNNFNGTVFGATLTTDRFGNTNRAYNFDGYDDEIQVIHAEALNIIGDISLSAWFNSIEAPLFRTCHTILIKRSQTSSLSFPYAISINYQYGIPNDYKKFLFVSFANNTGQYIQSTSSIINGVWNHIVCVVRNDSIKAFLNGVLILNTKINNQLRAGNSFPLMIGSGARSDKPAEQFKGQLDDIRIYNRALTDEEMQALYWEGQ